MIITALVTAFLLLGTPVAESQTAGEQADPLCAELQAFLSSVKPGETRDLTMRTYWGARKEGDEIVLGSKSCDYDDYQPGKKLCAYMIQHSSTEFAGHNVKRILNCLTPKPGIAANVDIHSGSFSTSFGSPNKGALIDLQLIKDKESNEMVLRLQADGY